MLQDLVPVLVQEPAAQGDDARRVVVVDPMAGLAERFMRAGGSLLGPLPVPLVVDRTALRADGRLVRLGQLLVGIGDEPVLGTPPPAHA